MSAFLVGGAFYLFLEKIFSIISIIFLLICLNLKNFAKIGLFIFGSYLLFNFALNYKNKFLNSIGAKTDVSYGVYLYAWPIQIYIIKYYPHVNLYFLIIFTLVLSMILGYMSWVYLEKPFMQLKKKLDVIDERPQLNKC